MLDRARKYCEGPPKHDREAAMSLEVEQTSIRASSLVNKSCCPFPGGQYSCFATAEGRRRDLRILAQWPNAERHRRLVRSCELQAAPREARSRVSCPCKSGDLAILEACIIPSTTVCIVAIACLSMEFLSTT